TRPTDPSPPLIRVSSVAARAPHASLAVRGHSHAPHAPIHHLEAVEHYLRDPLAMLYDCCRTGVVLHHDEPFIGIVGVGGSRRVGEHEAPADRDRAPDAHLRLVAVREARSKSEWHERRHPRLQHETSLAVSADLTLAAVPGDAHAPPLEVGAHVV